MASDITQGNTNTDATELDESDPSRKKIADRDWINDIGEVVKEEEATGVRYKFLGRDDREKSRLPAARRVLHNPSGDSITVYFRDLTDKAKDMAAGFGLITRMGNWTNAWLTDVADDRADFPEQVIQEGLRLMNEGKWIDRIEGVGALRFNPDKLAEAIFAVLGKGSVAQFREKIEADPEFVKTARAVPAVKAKYLELVGKPEKVKTADDLALLAGV